MWKEFQLRLEGNSKGNEQDKNGSKADSVNQYENPTPDVGFALPLSRWCFGLPGVPERAYALDSTNDFKTERESSREREIKKS